MLLVGGAQVAAFTFTLCQLPDMSLRKYGGEMPYTGTGSGNLAHVKRDYRSSPGNT